MPLERLLLANPWDHFLSCIRKSWCGLTVSRDHAGTWLCLGLWEPQCQLWSPLPKLLFETLISAPLPQLLILSFWIAFSFVRYCRICASSLLCGNRKSINTEINKNKWPSKKKEATQFIWLGFHHHLKHVLILIDPVLNY